MEAEQARAVGRNHPGVPDDKAQRNFTDPDSRITPVPGGRDFQQSYNYQAVVDSDCQVIVAARATNVPSDKQQAAPMVAEATLNTGEVPKELSADAGYYSARAVEELCALGVNPFIAPDRTRHGTRPEPAPRGRIPKGLSARDRNAAEAADETGAGTLRAADGYGVVGVRADQAGTWLQTIPAAGPGRRSTGNGT